MMVRERADDEDDEVVTRGSMRNPTLALIIDDIVEELLALSEEVQSHDDTRIDTATDD
jgi:hypothetical protein